LTLPLQERRCIIHFPTDGQLAQTFHTEHF